MNLASYIYGIIVPVRDHISYNTIRLGTILKIYPAERSHVSKPYKVKIIHLEEGYFKTCMLDGYGNNRYFHFDSDEWKNYHHCRFKIYIY